MSMNPEQQAREQIDHALKECGWAVQDYKAFDPSAAVGIALREVPLKLGRCDYLLMVCRQGVGVLNAEKWAQLFHQWPGTRNTIETL